jgi:hypothetical protein
MKEKKKSHINFSLDILRMYATTSNKIESNPLSVNFHNTRNPTQ